MLFPICAALSSQHLGSDKTIIIANVTIPKTPTGEDDSRERSMAIFGRSIKSKSTITVEPSALRVIGRAAKAVSQNR